MTAIPLGRPSLERLDATYPPAPRAASTLAYLVLLRVEIARFTRSSALRADSRRARALPAARPEDRAATDSSL